MTLGTASASPTPGRKQHNAADSRTEYHEQGKGPIEGDVGSQDGQISATLPWPVTQVEAASVGGKGCQHPIVPTQSKNQPTVKPSRNKVVKSQEESDNCEEQDVEMLDVENRRVIEEKQLPAESSVGSQDPIETWSCTKPSGNNMETDTEGNITGQQQLLHQKPIPLNDEKKQSKEKVVALASPQKGSSDMKNFMTGEMIKQQPAANNGSVRRPPGITILQYANILSNGREKSDRKNASAVIDDNKNMGDRQNGTAKSRATTLKDTQALGDI